MPLNCSWVLDVVGLMDAHPGMGAMGLKGYTYSFHEGTMNAGQHFKVGCGENAVHRCDGFG